MKTLVFGDIHGRDCWKDIIPKEFPDNVIFLGDYVSTHDGIDPGTQISNLKDILECKMLHMDDVILLRGNHDMQHLGYSWAECSGYNREVERCMIEIRDKFLHLSKWLHIEDNTIFSHAGVSTEWLNQVIKTESIQQINDIDPCWYFGFWPSKMSDYYGISPTQPPTWIRPQTLIEYMPEGYNQVVGHTRLGGIKKLKGDLGQDLWCCDALPQQYLVIEDGKFIVKEYDGNN